MIDEQLQWKKLDVLLRDHVESELIPSLEVSGLALDSRKVRPGHAYVALQGTVVHGLDFAETAIDSGAAAILVDSVDAERARSQLPDATLVAIEKLQQKLGLLASRWYGNPSHDMKLCGVTGTDGKTSVCRFVRDALRSLGFSTGYIGTIGWGLDDELEPNPLTTPDPITLQSMLADMYRDGARFIALECSSHALVQGRVNGVMFDVAVLTNIGRDHLDYHGDVESYRAAKRLLFDAAGLSAAVINADDDFGKQLGNQLTTPVTTYSAKGSHGNVKATDIVTDGQGLSFVLHEGSFSRPLSARLLGGFNVDNLLACYCTLRCFGIEPADAATALTAITPVPGRMEHFNIGGSVNAVVDFAHTPQALEAALRTLRPHCQGKLTVVFGCGGDRDPGKRPEMGAIAGVLADVVVVTDDNPRGESSSIIIDHIVAGISSDTDYDVVSDRLSAIHHALERAEPGDWVLIAGKGHEDYQIVGENQVHFSDRDTVRQWILQSANGEVDGRQENGV